MKKRGKRLTVQALSILFSRDWLVNAAVTGLLILAIEYDILVLSPDDVTAAAIIHVLLVVVIVIRVKWEGIQDWVDDSTDAEVESEDEAQNSSQNSC